MILETLLTAQPVRHQTKLPSAVSIWAIVRSVLNAVVLWKTKADVLCVNHADIPSVVDSTLIEISTGSIKSGNDQGL